MIALTELSVIEKKNISLRKIGREVGIAKTSARKILTEFRYRPYKMERHQQLVRDDPYRRMVHCELMIEEIHHNPELPLNIVFSDESKMVITNGPNKQLVQFWRTNAPEEVMSVGTQYQQKVNVWIGLYGPDLIGPFFFENNINGQNYLNMIQNQAVPAIRQLEQYRNVSNCRFFMIKIENNTKVKIERFLTFYYLFHSFYEM